MACGCLPAWLNILRKVKESDHRVWVMPQACAFDVKINIHVCFVYRHYGFYTETPLMVSLWYFWGCGWGGERSLPSGVGGIDLAEKPPSGWWPWSCVWLTALSHHTFHTCISLKHGKLCGFQGAGMVAENDFYAPQGVAVWEVAHGCKLGQRPCLLSSPF